MGNVKKKTKYIFFMMHVLKKKKKIRHKSDIFYTELKAYSTRAKMQC